MNQRLASLIQKQYEEISSVFSHFQKQSGLLCRSGCGLCCLKKSIYCTPIELLPVGLKLLAENKADEYLLKTAKNHNGFCVFLEIIDESKGEARCGEYAHRPFICRSFAVSARKDKYGNPDYSICKVIKEDHPRESAEIQKVNRAEDDLPYMELWRKKLEVLDPLFMDKEYPINQALHLMLEKLLLLESLEKFN